MKISVITPTHNRIALLKKAVTSFLNQNYRNAELIVLDNGCTDGSTEYLKQIADNNHNVKIIRNEKNILLGHLNQLWNAADGDLICQLHDDDMLTPDSLSIRAQRFKDDPFLDVCYGGWINIIASGGTMGTYKGQSSDPSRIIKSEYINFTTMMWKNELKNKFMFDEDLRYYVDWLFKIRCAMECSMTCVESPVMYYRIHSAQESATCRLENQNGPEEALMRKKIKELYSNLF
jgi:glycosyltransferase involved in cell wall biosynthesis